DTVRHDTGLLANNSYTVTRTLRAPAGLTDTEEFYVFVVTDPVRTTSYGAVFELDKETNNDRSSAVPMVVELPPPADLVVPTVTGPGRGRAGAPLPLRGRGKNQSPEPALGPWSAPAYRSLDGTWDIGDVPLGRVDFTAGSLAAGDTYTQTLNTKLPPVTPG